VHTISVLFQCSSFRLSLSALCTLSAFCFSAVPSALARIFDVHILQIFFQSFE
jgi:hypothetical protein